MDKLKRFYLLKPWRDLSYNLKIAAGGKCQRCDYQVVDIEDYKYLIGHHKIELTEDNVDDPNISLNPDNIEIVCIWCHNKEHDRFQGGYKKKAKRVYIVYGSPLSGKSTLVNELYKQGDIILDLDKIWHMITLEDKYIKPDNIKFNVFKLRDSLLDQIKTRYGNWNNAYIIGGYPDKYERERLARELGAELIYVEATKEECLARVEMNNRPKVWIKYIEDWFERNNK